MYAHEYKCKGDSSMKPRNWNGVIQTLCRSSSAIETEVQSRGSCFHIIMGRHKYGNYLCIPNWGIGIEMADFNDTFWTFEKLTQKYPNLNRIDAVSITYAVAEIALIME